MELAEYETIIPNIVVDGMTFIVPNTHCAWRIETLYTKEPDTIEWIKSMKKGEVLYDIGANIGQYSIFAAHHGVFVHAFEPEAQNFALLCRNIAINKFSPQQIQAWPLALSDKPSIQQIHLSVCMPGGSCHSYGESKDFHGNDKTFPYHHGSVATTIDIFSHTNVKPDHIKIDVDGFEHLVIQGAICTLDKVKSVLIEINTAYPAHMELTKYMDTLGFEVDMEQVNKAQRKEGPFKGVGNWIFHRTLP
jgi:FkbM family methyltransferase